MQNDRYGNQSGYGNRYSGQSRQMNQQRPGIRADAVQSVARKTAHEKLTEENYVLLADKAITALCNNKDRFGNPSIVSTSKIRNLLAMSADIYNDVVTSLNEELSAEVKGRINYLKIRMIYEAGREETIKKFLDESDLTNHIDDINGSRRQFILFNHYMEALVAYRKFYVKEKE